MAYQSWEIDVPRQVFCEAHRQRFAVFGVLAESMVAAHAMRALILGGRITSRSTQTEIDALMHSLEAPFCCWLGEQALNQIEDELLGSRTKH